jgi:hypothetical protein
MFKVANADFIADKLASELLPDQEYREAAKNAEEAIRRRMEAAGDTSGGRIEIDIDWAMLEATGNWYVSCADDGDGMSRVELERYMTTLAVQGAGLNQSLTGNQGMGLKISGPTRHKEGVLIRSMKDGERTMVQVGWNKQTRQYGLIPLDDFGKTIVSVPEEMFPDFIRSQGSGTVVTFLGNTDSDNTIWPGPPKPKNWLFKYLNQRFFRFSHDGVEMKVRQPSGEVSDWPRSRDAANQGKSFNLATVKGTAAIWDDAADRDGSDRRGVVDVPGDPVADIPAARVHWWILPTGPGTDVSTRTASGGSIAVLFQNELHDWRMGNQANPYFARMGVLFGKNRIAFVLEPQGSTVAADFARAHVLIGGKPVFEADAWLVWSEQFRPLMPDAIKATMHDEQARLQAEDPDRARRIQDRLKDVMSLLRPRRFRRSSNGSVTATAPTVSGADSGDGSVAERPTGAGRRQGAGSTRGIGSVLTQVDDIAGEPATEVFSILKLEPMWVTEAQAEGLPIVNGNGKGLHDRAAALAGEDGVGANILLLNLQFRGYQAILAAVNEWANPEGDEAKAVRIEQFTQEWVEQKMVEAVNGLRQLENGSTWTPANFDEALSPVALTAAFMADRYHTLREVRRQVGSMRTAEASG